MATTRPVRLAENLGGINRRRQKGGASKDDLTDLLNGYRTPLGTLNSRPGTSFEFTGPANTKGMLGFAGKLHVFSHTPQAHAIANLVVNVLKHPTGGAATIDAITSAFPFFGRIYVVARFTDGVVQHYWLENPDAWVMQKTYEYGDRVQPTTPNGFYYQITNVRADAQWAKNTEKAVNNTVQPTTYNSRYYILDSATGTPIKTSSTEPTWPLVHDPLFNQVLERRWLSDLDAPPGAAVTQAPPDPAAGGGGPRGGAGNYGPFPPGRDPTIVFIEP